MTTPQDEPIQPLGDDDEQSVVVGVSVGDGQQDEGHPGPLALGSFSAEQGDARCEAQGSRDGIHARFLGVPYLEGIDGKQQGGP